MQPKEILEELAEIDTFMFDVDGVFTDNRVLLFPGLDPVRTFHSRDAYAVQHAIKEGLRIIITTGGIQSNHARLTAAATSSLSSGSIPAAEFHPLRQASFALDTVASSVKLMSIHDIRMTSPSGL